jgi:ABC-type dipeptide/oligopeptide/nickel transport system permease component
LHNIFIVIPQLVVALLSTFIFAEFAPEKPIAAVPVPNVPPEAVDLVRRQVEGAAASANWDSIGLMFRCVGAP